MFYSSLNPIFILLQPRSKSDWDIHEMPPNSPLHSSDEDFALRPKSDENADENFTKSQYFDALDTIVEIEEEHDDVEKAKDSGIEDEWEDLPDKLEDIPEENSLRMKRFLRDQNKKHKIQFSPQIKRRVQAMKKLQSEYRNLESKFYQEMSLLELKYQRQTMQNFFNTRAKLIRTNYEEGEIVGGVPNFWLHAMLRCETLKTIIQDHDRQVLKYLQDVRVFNKTKSLGFVLEFHFAKNEFFVNEVLKKEYDIRYDKKALNGRGPEVVGCKGCKIQWYKGKNVTLR